jgi:hypothetical protein
MLASDKPEGIEKIYGATGDNWKYAKMSDGSWMVYDTDNPDKGWLKPGSTAVAAIEAQVAEGAAGEEYESASGNTYRMREGALMMLDPRSGEEMPVDPSSIKPEDVPFLLGLGKEKGGFEAKPRGAYLLEETQGEPVEIDKSEIEGMVPIKGEPVEIDKSEIEDLAAIKGEPVEIDKGDIEELSQMQKGEIAIDKGELENLARMQAHGEMKEKNPTDMLKPDYGAKLVMDTLKSLLISPEERQVLMDRASERRKMFWGPQAYEAPKREKK